LPGIRDIIDSGEQGFLVEPTTKMLGTSIEMLVRDEGMRRRLGAGLQERVMDKFSIHSMIDRTFLLYSSKP
jgi:glycosyltransferase involved in cell wall biosynthesis